MAVAFIVPGLAVVVTVKGEGGMYPNLLGNDPRDYCIGF